MLLSDFFKLMYRMIRKNRLLFLLWCMLQLISFYLIIWTFYNYQERNQSIWQYQKYMKWKQGETINVEIRIPGLMPEDSYIENVADFLAHCDQSDGIKKAGAYAYRNDYFAQFPYEAPAAQQDGLVDLLYISAGVQDFCDLSVARYDSSIAQKYKDKIPVLVGAAYQEAEIGDILCGMDAQYVVVGVLNKGATWYDTDPLYTTDRSTKVLDHHLVARVPGDLPDFCTGNAFHNIYIQCQKGKTQQVKKELVKQLQKKGLIGIVKTPVELIQEYKDSYVQDYTFVRNVALMCLLISFISGAAIQFLIVQKQSYTFTVYYINGIDKKYFLRVYAVVTVFLTVGVYLLSFVIGTQGIAAVQKYDKMVYLTQTFPWGGVVCVVEMIAFFIISFYSIRKMQYNINKEVTI